MLRQVVSALTGVALLAQAPSPWAVLAAPGGASAAGTLSLGKVVASFDGNTVHAFSAVTRRWVAQPVGANTTLRITNDWLLARDGGSCFVFSAYTGRFTLQNLGPGGQVVNGTGNNNDSLLLLADGGQLHLFSAFTGAWVTRPLASTASLATTRHVALLADGNLLSAADAFTGQWHDRIIAQPVTNLSTDGTAAFADDGTTVHAFSANHRSWRTAALPAGAQLTRGADFGVFVGSHRQLGYSAIRGEFAVAASTPGSVPLVQETFVLWPTSLGAFAYSAFRGSFSGPHGQPGAVPVTAGAVAMFADPAGAVAYSAVLDAATRWPAAVSGAAGAAGAAGSVGHFTDASSGRPVLYSGLTGTFGMAPPSALATPPLLTTTSAGVATATGLLAWNARTGRFTPLPTAPSGFTGNPSSAPLAAWDNNSLFAFDARTDRWIATPRATTNPPQLSSWRTTLVAIDGGMAYGFGAQAGHWSAQPLPEPVASQSINSESGRIHTANYLLAYSAVGGVLAHAQFPEFRRIQPIGAELRLVLPVPSTALCVLGAGPLAAGPIGLPGVFGRLELDPNGIATMLVPSPPNGDPAVITIALPATPHLIGMQLGCQAAVLPNNAGAWLTEAATIQLL